MSKSKRKGTRNEHLAVKALEDCGFHAERVFGSGAYEAQLGNDFKGDIRLTTPTDSFAVECKVRARGFSTLYNWLEDGRKDMLMVRADRKEWLAVIPMSTLSRILGADDAE